MSASIVCYVRILRHKQKFFKQFPKGYPSNCNFNECRRNFDRPIPDVRYVVDCGRQKKKIMTKGSSVASFEVKDGFQKHQQNKEKVEQGRTGPGHCYRLYSLSIF